MSFYYQDKRRVLPFHALRRMSNRINVAKAEQSERGQQLLRWTLIADYDSFMSEKIYIYLYLTEIAVKSWNKSTITVT